MSLTCNCHSNNSQTFRPPAGDLWDYADISRDKCIAPGLKVRNWIQYLTQEEYCIQRVTERAYFIGAAGYNAVAVTGDKGVLLVGTQSGVATTHTLKALRTLSDLPVTDIVYTHYHMDHIGGSAQIVSETGQRFGVASRIWASSLTARQIDRFGSKVPMPTNVIEGHDGEFLFEGKPVRIHTPEYNGHCVDNAIIHLPTEGIVQFDDMIEPECMPFPHFGPQENLRNFEDNMTELQGMTWNFVNGGHGNLGSHGDVKFYLDYFDKMRNATAERMDRLSMTDFIVPTYSYMSSWLNYLAAIGALVKEDLRAEYGLHYGFEETVPTHVEMMINHLIMY